MSALRTSAAPVALPAQRDRSGSRRTVPQRLGRSLTPWLFLAPALIFFGVFKFWPSIWGVYLSLFHVQPYLGDQWLGAANFTRTLDDPDLQAAVWHTVLDAFVQVAGSMLVGFVLALLLEGPARHLRILRTAVFLPAVIAMVAVAELWHALLFPGRYGAVNSLLGDVGLGPLPFLASPNSSLWTIMLVQIWKHAPYDMVIFIAGLVGIDRELYEQSSIDGANAWQRLWNVTLPALRPITTIVLILGLIRGLRVFTEIYVLTGGGPGGSTESIVTYVYRNVVANNDIGYAAAISALLLAATIILTAVTLRWRRHRENA